MTHINFLVTALLDGIWQGAFLAAAMLLLLKLFPRLNPTTRFSLLWVALIAVVALPLARLASVSLTPRARMESHAPTTANESATAAPATIRKQESILIPRRQTPRAESYPAFTPNSSSPHSETKQALYSLQEPEQDPGRHDVLPVAAAAAQPLLQIRSGRALVALEIIWALLSFVLLVRLGLGIRKLRRLKAGALPAQAEWQLRLKTSSQANGISRQTRLLVSSHVAAPMSLGFLNPAILIPQALFETLSDAELEHVVLHELAHLRRRDDWTNLAQKLIEAMLPIQPAVYWIGHRMCIEREMACDDWVIAITGRARPYAASLTKVAEITQWRRADILAAGATGNRSQLFSRVQNMLNDTRNAAPKLTLIPLAAAIAAIGTFIYVGARAPQLVAFAQSSAHESSRQQPITPSLPDSPQTVIESSVPAAPSASQAPPAQIAALSSPAHASSLQSPLSPGVSGIAVAALSPAASAVAEQSGETHMEMTTQNGATFLRMKVDGVIEFTDDDHDVRSLSPHGHFRMEDGKWLSGGRAYDVTADSAGNLTKTYSVGESARPLDAEGRAWLERLLPKIIRESGVGAESRVARFLRQGGPNAVLAEIGLIHSDGSKRTYVEQLFGQATLDTAQLKDAARLIRSISSDGDKAQVLITVDGKYFTKEMRPYLFEAAEGISSDGDKRRVLSDIVKKDGGDADTLVSAAKVARHISSDGDKAEVLIEIANTSRTDDVLDLEYFEAVKSVSSDGDHARVLSAVLKAHGGDHNVLAQALRSAGRISSDGDKARVLKEAVSRFSEDEPIRKAFLDSANSIASDGDHQQVLVALAARQGISAPTLAGIAKSAQRISSDGDKARVLIELAGANIDAVRDDFFSAADSISSDGDHSRVLTTVLDKPGAPTTVVIAAIQSATRISSDGDKERVLLDAANRYSKDPAVDAALRKAVESVHSDGLYRSVMSEIARHAGGS